MGNSLPPRRRGTVEVPLERARQLALECQGFPREAPRSRPRKSDIVRLVEKIGYLQLDPTNIVVRSHLLVLWSRLGKFDFQLVDQLLEKDKRLFEYWTHAAAIVPASDFSFHRHRMRHYLVPRRGWGPEVWKWARQNSGLRDEILGRLQRDGPLGVGAFDDREHTGWTKVTGTAGRNIGEMLLVLWMQGEVAVARRKSGRRVWDLAERHYAAMLPDHEVEPREGARRAVERAMGALGIATPPMISQYGFAGHFGEVSKAIRDFVEEGRLVPIDLAGAPRPLSETWYARSEDLAELLGTRRGGDWNRATLLSPFDNLIAHRGRAEAVFGLRYRIEIYTPRSKRVFGYFALPVLDGDRFIGTVETELDRRRRRLAIHQGHPLSTGTENDRDGKAVDRAVRALATFVGAGEVVYGTRFPKGWARDLRTGPADRST